MATGRVGRVALRSSGVSRGFVDEVIVEKKAGLLLKYCSVLRGKVVRIKSDESEPNRRV